MSLTSPKLRVKLADVGVAQEHSHRGNYKQIEFKCYLIMSDCCSIRWAIKEQSAAQCKQQWKNGGWKAHNAVLTLISALDGLIV